MENTQTNTQQNTTTLPTDGGVDVNKLMTALQNNLLSNGGISSSGGSEMETNIRNAISSINTGKDAGNRKIESEFTRSANYLGEEFNQKQIAGREQGTGGVVAFGALKALTESTDKSLKDMAMRKEELIMSNNIAAANKITDLEIQAIDYREKARQQTFNNILSLGQFGETVKSGKREENAQAFIEKQTLSEIALKYGVNVNEGDTIESVVTRAMPTASRQVQAELAKTLAETRRINNESAKILKGESLPSVDSTTLDSLSHNLLDLEKKEGKEEYLATLETIKNSGGITALNYTYNKMKEINNERLSLQQKEANDRIKQEQQAQAALKAAQIKRQKNIFTKNGVKFNNSSFKFGSGFGK